MGTVMESKLVSAFKFFDINGNGAITKDELSHICKQLDPNTWTDEKLDIVFEGLDKGQTGYIDYSEFAISMTSGMQDSHSLMNIYDVASAKLPGEKLAAGDLTDAGVDKMRSYLTNAFDIRPEEYDTPKIRSKLTWLQEIGNLLDPSLNPGGFRYCQRAIIEHAAVGPLLLFARKALSDGVVIKSLEVLARTAFGNVEAAVEVASNEHFLQTLHAVLAKGVLPEQLAVVQLAQAIAASSIAPQVKEMLPQMLAQVVPLLTNSTFTVLPCATFEVLVSVSFSAPDAIVNALSWPGVASFLAESTESGRPAWMDQENLTVLACGFLATNVIALPVPAFDYADELQVRQKMLEYLSTSNFLEFFVLAMEAAVTQREWPASSGAFHSVSRLASLVRVLAGLGFRRQLVGAVAPLAKAVEINPDEDTTRVALLALRSLVDDVSCLEMFLSLSEFRSETLEVLHKAGDEMEATDLTSCTTTGENALAAAQTTFEQSELKSPPSVRFLAELFNECAPMDGELTKDELLCILPRIPIGPARDVEASLSGDRACKFDFVAVAQRIYGTPTRLGWWPSLMDDVNLMWHQSAFQELHPPPLNHVLHYYEFGAKGMSGVSSDVILHEVLPAWGLPVEGELVEDVFAEIRGETLSFAEFAHWMCKYFYAVDKQRK